MKTSIFDLQHLHLESYLFKLFPHGKISGREFLIGDIHGNPGSSLSFNLDKGCGSDFAATDNYKNIVELIMQKFGLEEQAAFKKIEKDWGVDKNTPATPRASKKKPQIKAIPFDTKIEFIEPDWLTEKYGNHTAKWLYEQPDGMGICWVLRYDFINEDKKPDKDYRPFILGEDKIWYNKSLEKPRPLYNLPEIKQSNNIILITAGEKSAEAARAMLPGLTVTTHSNGEMSVKENDWSVLAGKKILLWRDNDIPGQKWEKALAEILTALGCIVRVFRDDAFLDRPKGWDIADLQATQELQGQLLMDWIKLNIIEYQRGGADTSDSTSEGAKSASLAEEPLNKHFRFLGLVGSRFALYNYHSGQVEEKGPDSFTEAYCRALVCGAEDYWRRLLQTKKGEKISWKSIVGVLANDFYKLGQFDMDRVRGLGCWIDNKRIVFNTGNYLYIEGQKIPINQFESYYVYTRGETILEKMDTATTREELIQLEELCNMFAWEYPVCGTLLAGWLMVAPICGALPWRPHIYITGMAGTGKSTIHDNLLARTLGQCAIITLGDSTKAGLAQSGKIDALPIIFDEIENDNMQDAMRNESVVKMARLSSSSQKGKTLKGRADQSGAEGYVSRSCFCFSSITPSVKHYADYTRITLLPLIVDHGATKEIAVSHFKKVVLRIRDLMGDDIHDLKFSEKFITYANSSAMKIIKSYEILKEIAQIGATAFSARIADQIGMLLAGYWAYKSDEPITPEEAQQLLLSYNWEELIPNKKQENQMLLISKLVQHKVRVMNEGNQKHYWRTIADLVDYVAHDQVFEHRDTNFYEKKYAELLLQDMGFRIEEFSGQKFVAVSNISHELNKILVGTQWGNNWGHSLKAIPGAFPSEQKWFGKSIGSQRCTMVPLSVFISKE